MLDLLLQDHPSMMKKTSCTEIKNIHMEYSWPNSFKLSCC